MRFTDAIAALRERDGHWEAPLPEAWGQGRTVFGGLQAALAVAAIRGVIGHDIPLRSLQTVFVGPVPPGLARIRVDVLRQGKSTIHAQAWLDGDEGMGCQVLAVFGHRRESSVRIELPWPSVDRPPEDSPLQPFVEGRSPNFLRFVQQRWARGAMPFRGGSEARTQIYVHYPEEAAMNESLVIAYADTIPSPVVSMLDRFAPASSMCWTLEFLRDDLASLPLGHWLMDAHATAAGDGYAFQTAHLFSADRKAVALSRQSAVIFG